LTKEIHQQQSQPIHSAMIGLALLLGWFMAGYLFSKPIEQLPASSFSVEHLYPIFFEQFIFWKLYTLIAFIFGIRAYIYTEQHFTDRIFYIKSGIWFLVAVMLSFIHFMALSLIPLFIFGGLLFRIRKINPSFYLILIGIFMLLIMGLSIFMSVPDSHSSCFSGFFIEKSNEPIALKIFDQLKSGSNLIAWLFGFIVMVIGYSVGKTKWLLDYHNHYIELRRLFFISLGLVLTWGILHYLNYYTFLKSFRVGSFFYLFDALSVHLLIVYMYLFILVYLENFRIGIMLLRFFAKIGKLWLLNLLILFGFIFIGNYYQLVMNAGTSIIVAFAGFLFCGMLSVIFGPRLFRKLHFGI
jgi:hypothetical protein